MEKPLPNHTPFDAGGTLRFHWGTRRWEVKPHVGTRRRIPGHTEFRQNTTEMAVSQSTVALGARFVGAPGGISRECMGSPPANAPAVGRNS